MPEHAELIVQPQSVRLAPLGDARTYVNGQLLAGNTLVQDGDRIEFGSDVAFMAKIDGKLSDPAPIPAPENMVGYLEVAGPDPFPDAGEPDVEPVVLAGPVVERRPGLVGTLLGDGRFENMISTRVIGGFYRLAVLASLAAVLVAIYIAITDAESRLLAIGVVALSPIWILLLRLLAERVVVQFRIERNLREIIDGPVEREQDRLGR